jgi:hypothetical protein
VGTVHDMKMLVTSKLWSKQCIQNSYCYLDSGFQGIQVNLPNSITPIKKPPTKRRTKDNPNPTKTSLTKDEKWYNKTLSQTRIQIENINREIKIFTICHQVRRQKQKKHNLFWTLVAGIVNFKRNY